MRRILQEADKHTAGTNLELIHQEMGNDPEAPISPSVMQAGLMAAEELRRLCLHRADLHQFKKWAP